MIYFAGFVTEAAFIVSLCWFGVVPAATKALDVSRFSIKTMRDPTLSDEDRERTLQKSSLTLLRSFLSITARGAAAVGASMLPMVAFHSAGLARFSDVTDFLATWEAILMASVLLSLFYLARRRV